MSSNLDHYHHPENDQFSLDFVSPDGEEIDKRLDSYDDRTETRVWSYDLDEEVFVIFVKTNEVAKTENIRYTLDATFSDMDSETRVLIREMLEIFRRIQEQKRNQQGVPLDAYKGIEVGRIPEAFERVDWSATVPKTSGQLASNLILCHALPNANHRTAFGMLETYLKAVSSSFDFPPMVTDDYGWQTWVDEYIVDSKRLLTVRRNVGRFRYLRAHGCETVRRKGGIEIEVSEYDLDMHQHEALTTYARRHERRTTAFVETILRKMGHSELVAEPSVEKSCFAEHLRGLS